VLSKGTFPPTEGRLNLQLKTNKQNLGFSARRIFLGDGQQLCYQRLQRQNKHLDIRHFSMAYLLIAPLQFRPGKTRLCPHFLNAFHSSQTPASWQQHCHLIQQRKGPALISRILHFSIQAIAVGTFECQVDML